MRHATQLAWLHAVSKEDAARSDALARFMLKAGFVPGEDLRAAIFGRGRDAPRDFSYRHQPFLDAYGDCELEPPSTPRAYPYRSKACGPTCGPTCWRPATTPCCRPSRPSRR